MKMIERTKKSLFIEEIGEILWFSNEQSHAVHRVWLCPWSYVVGDTSRSCELVSRAYDGLCGLCHMIDE